MDKFKRNAWVKVPESDSTLVPASPKHRIDDAFLLKPKVGRETDRNRLTRHFLMLKRVTKLETWNLRTLNIVGELACSCMN